MKLFGNNIDPFSEFTINLGPAYISRLFEMLLIKKGVADVHKLSYSDRLQKYIDLLETNNQKGNHTKRAIICFYLAHFNHQLADNLSESKIKFYEKAIYHYQSYLKLTKGAEQSKFYAQWQVGMLLDYLQYPWAAAQDELLKARTIDLCRGEAIKKIIDHYLSTEEWPIAYLFSSYSIEHFYDRNPIASRCWYVDFNCYNWKVLDTQIQVCCKTGKYKEAETVYQELLNYVLEHLYDFNLPAINYIHSIGNSFPYTGNMAATKLSKTNYIKQALH
jgi:pentatricopeptide repeat protein